MSGLSLIKLQECKWVTALFGGRFTTIIELCTYLANDSEIQYGESFCSVEI